MLLLESVPNFSEGRDRGVVDAIGAALGVRARLLDVHSDGDHNRSVYTLVGSAEELADALIAGIACARDRVDLRRHDGAHPRIGAADVVPIVPLELDDMPRAHLAKPDIILCGAPRPQRPVPLAFRSRRQVPNRLHAWRGSVAAARGTSVS